MTLDRVQHQGLAIFHRICSISVLCYVILYQILYQRGYQATDTFTGTPLIKIKGFATTRGKSQFFDAVDLTQPSIEESAVFIQTNYLETRAQFRGTCPGNDTEGASPARISEVCDCRGDDVSCLGGKCIPNVQTQNGISTGRCLETMGTPRWMCEISSWCPLEDDTTTSDNILDHVANFTLFLRLDGRFANLLPDVSISNFKNRELVWNRNLFYLSDLIAAAETGQRLEPVAYRHAGVKDASENQPMRLSEEYFHEITKHGAELLIDVMWNCNLDKNIELCAPQFSIKRIDGGKGYNYRSSNEYYAADGQKLRDVIKRYGVRIVFRVQGSGGHFSFTQCTIVLGSGVGLLGIATVLADVLLMYGGQNKEYQDMKFAAVDHADEEETHDLPYHSHVDNSNQ